MSTLRASPCPDCGVMMLGEPFNVDGHPIPHGARTLGKRCEHGKDWMRNCVGAAIPPACCPHLYVPSAKKPDVPGSTR